MLDDFRAQTNAEVAELRRRSAEQLDQERDRVLADLEPHVRELAGELASRVVGEQVASGGRS